MTDMQFHPLANIFPLIDGQAYSDLIADIIKHGVREPVWLYEGKILDGRNRWRAAQVAGVQCHTRVYEGDDPAGFVVSLNLHRRHLSESQRAMVAARLATLKDGVRADRQGAPIGAPTQDDAADMLNVGRRSVQRARDVIEDGAPELAEAVERGAISVSLASQVAALPREEQEAVTAAPPDQIRDVAREVVHNHRAQGTGENEWYTPAEYIEAAREFMGAIDLDPASSEKAQETVKAARFFTAADDGLVQPWDGRIWLNPPYAQPAIGHFIAKVVQELPNFTEAVVLTHNYTDTAWFHLAASNASALCFTRGRIGFLSPEGKRAAPTQGQAFFYFGQRQRAFADCFSRFGLVVMPA